MNFPLAREGSSTTLSVANLITDLALSVIEALGADIATMRILPQLHFADDFCTPESDPGSSRAERCAPVKNDPYGATAASLVPDTDTPVDGAAADCCTGLPTASEDHTRLRPESRLQAAMMLMDEFTDAVAAPRKHQNQCAALTAVLIDRLQDSAQLEATVLTLSTWQHQPHMTVARAEIAGILNIPEGMAGRLMDYATTFVHHLPATFAAWSDGWLT